MGEAEDDEEIPQKKQKRTLRKSAHLSKPKYAEEDEASNESDLELVSSDSE